MQDSSTTTGKDTQSISIVTNYDDYSHWSAEIQGRLADVLSTVSSEEKVHIPSNTTK
jgi:hypothetical protein